MKKVISTSLFITSLIALNACTKDSISNEVLINFINKTGATIQNATADSIQIGTIVENGQTGFIRFEKFRIDSQMPDCNFIGVSENDTLNSTSKFYFCGTEKSLLKPGKYNVEVKIDTSRAERLFDLRFK